MFPVSVVVTSCGRFDLLSQTLKSFFENNTYKFLDEIIIIDDSGNKNAHQIINDLIKDVSIKKLILINEKNIGQIKSIDKAYSYVKNEYIFHMEDDWEFYKSGFIEESLKILEKHSSIITVWLRNINDTNGHPLEMDHNLNFRLAKLGYNGSWHGFTWNPGLRRLSDYKKIISFEKSAPSEMQASILYKNLGYRAAITLNDDGFVKHIGNLRSTAQMKGTKKG